MTLRRIPIGGWQRCVHEAAAFESAGEFAAACLLDASERVSWWLRNDPAIFQIPTPIGLFEPDFVFCCNSPQGDMLTILEVKGEIFWNPDGSNARVKSKAACAWVKATRAASAKPIWNYAIVLDQDARDASSLEALLAVALERAP